MKKTRLKFNAPAVLIFSLLCLAGYALNFVTSGWANRTLLSVYRGSLLNPLTYIRCVTHVLGHSSFAHLTGNLMYILILGPILEEKYGTENIAFVMVVTALVTGIINIVFFPFTRLLGASSIVFAFILLASITDVGERAIPVTFLLVAVLYFGRELYEAFFVADNISHVAHLAGGITGSVLGFVMNRNKMGRFAR